MLCFHLHACTICAHLIACNYAAKLPTDVLLIRRSREAGVVEVEKWPHFPVWGTANISVQAL